MEAVRRAEEERPSGCEGAYGGIPRRRVVIQRKSNAEKAELVVYFLRMRGRGATFKGELGGVTC